MSHPFFGQHFDFTQPDGSTIRVRGWGDQQQAVFETLDGQILRPDRATGELRLVTDMSAARAAEPGLQAGLPTRGTRWQQRRAERQLARASDILLAPPQRQTVGTFVGLCLLIDFSDEWATIAQAEVEAFCNRAGYTGFGNNGSVSDYFRDVSGNRVHYTNLVAPYYRARHPRAYYTDESIAQPTRATELITEALDNLLHSGFDVSALATDNLGYVYALNVFYAGPVVNHWAKGLWPHAYHLPSPYRLRQGTAVHDYQITDLSNELSLGTFCHENGHMLCDFPDLYDYGGESSGVGAYCLMCAGGNIDRKNPVQVGAYLKYRAGWADTETPLAAGASVTLAAGGNHFAFVRKSPREYFVLEHRRRAGRDVALPGEGLAIWHIDELGDNSNEQMSPTEHYECTLIQADGRSDLERRRNLGDDTDLYPSGTNDSFGHGSVPRSVWWDGAQTDLEIVGIRRSGDTITLSVR